MNTNPAAPENNLHHTSTYRSEQDWWESEFGKGPGDPDVVGHYPGELTDEDIMPAILYMGLDAAVIDLSERPF